jgi:archaellum biogenesis protein FlaJ (TadC family)
MPAALLAGLIVSATMRSTVNLRERKRQFALN